MIIVEKLFESRKRTKLREVRHASLGQLSGSLLFDVLAKYDDTGRYFTVVKILTPSGYMTSKESFEEYGLEFDDKSSWRSLGKKTPGSTVKTDAVVRCKGNFRDLYRLYTEYPDFFDFVVFLSGQGSKRKSSAYDVVVNAIASGTKINDYRLAEFLVKSLKVLYSSYSELVDDIKGAFSKDIVTRIEKEFT